jgi:hypothetical protein
MAGPAKSAKTASEDAALRMLVPIGRSPYAIAAGYAGLLSLAICVLGPVAVILGILAILDMQKHPDRTGMPRAVLGIVLGCLGSLLLAAVVLATLLG